MSKYGLLGDAGVTDSIRVSLNNVELLIQSDRKKFLFRLVVSGVG